MRAIEHGAVARNEHRELMPTVGQCARQGRHCVRQPTSFEIRKQLAGRVGNSHVARLHGYAHLFPSENPGPSFAVLSPLPGGFPIMNVSERLLTQLARRDYVPAAAEAIAKQWRLKPKDRRNFFRTIDELTAAGRIVHIKGDRLCLPREADLVTGTINFRQKGSAMVYPEVKATEPRKA